MKTFALMTIALAALSGASARAADDQAGPPAKLTMAEAQEIALQAAPGPIVDSEYEKENGVWRYSFDIRQGGRIHEIGVDANTGKIVEDSYEGAKDKD